MENINIFERDKNFTNTIGKEWMLVAVGSECNLNTITINWAEWLWGIHISFIFIKLNEATKNALYPEAI